VTRPARIGRRALLLAALVCTTCSACAGLPGWETEMDADLYNKTSGDLLSYTKTYTGRRIQETTVVSGDAESLSLGGACTSAWWIQRAAGPPIRLDKICPGDKITVTDDAIEQ
jgi:hypothetical protein